MFFLLLFQLFNIFFLFLGSNSAKQGDGTPTPTRFNPPPTPLLRGANEPRRPLREHNLQHTELSFCFRDDEPSKFRHHRRNNPNESSVGYPRYLSELSFHEFSSIVRSTGDHCGGHGARRDGGDASLSGAEYDPERPLHAMIAGANSKHSMFDGDRSELKVQVFDYSVSSNIHVNILELGCCEYDMRSFSG
jgi:hypothetical protein